MHFVRTISPKYLTLKPLDGRRKQLGLFSICDVMFTHGNDGIESCSDAESNRGMLSYLH